MPSSRARAVASVRLVTPSFSFARFIDYAPYNRHLIHDVGARRRLDARLQHESEDRTRLAGPVRRLPRRYQGHGLPDPSGSVSGTRTRTAGRPRKRPLPGASRPPALLVRCSGDDRRAAAAPLLPLREAVACRSHRGCCRGSENGADHDVARVVHAGVDAGVCHPTRKQSDRQAQPRQVPADGVGECEG